MVTLEKPDPSSPPAIAHAPTMSEPPAYSARAPDDHISAHPAPSGYNNASNIELGQGFRTITPLGDLYDTPAMIICPFCKTKAMTKVDKHDTSTAFIVGALLCLVCIIASILPCLCGWFQDKHHTCSHCGKEVAVRHANGAIEVKGPPSQQQQGWTSAPNDVTGGPQQQQQQYLPPQSQASRVIAPTEAQSGPPAHVTAAPLPSTQLHAPLPHAPETETPFSPVSPLESSQK